MKGSVVPRMFRRLIQALGVAASLLQASAFAAPPAGGAILRNMASVTYVPGGYSQVETVASNEVRARIALVEALSLTLDQSVSQPPGVQVTLAHMLSNLGNVRSGYRLDWSNGGTACGNAPVSLDALKVVRDLNANGIVDAAEPAIALGTPDALSLAAGESATLLVQGRLPVLPTGEACLTLRATTSLQATSASNVDRIAIVDTAVLSLVKSAAFSGFAVPGASRIDFTITGTNIGAQDARAVAQGPGATAITVNGAPREVVLLRDPIPPGTQYVPGSLQSTAPGAMKLFRLASDAPTSYRGGAGVDDASVVEVAIALPAPAVVARNASIRMSFAVKVDAATARDITNVSQAYFNDGARAAQSASNIVLIPLNGSRIGVAKAASRPVTGVAGQTGVAESTFSIRVRNYGVGSLYHVQVPDVLEGQGASQFGAYTASPVPAAGQYTIVPGTLSVTQPNGRMGGTIVSVNPSFKGTSGASDLLAPDAVLTAGAEFVVSFTARWNTAGRGGTLSNSVTARASTPQDATQVIVDDSVDGTDPDPDHDGNPNNNAAPTLIDPKQAVMSLSKSASAPRRIGAGVYDVDFLVSVRNDGDVPATFVRVMDNLDCAFDMDLSTGKVAAWQLQGEVKAANGLLKPAAGFTGHATCNRDRQASSDAYDVPTQATLGLVDGTRDLQPGQVEQLGFTVRVTLKNAADSRRVRYVNKAWAVAMAQNAVSIGRDVVVGATTGQAVGFLVDPQGTVYDAVSRAPVAGAVVTLARQSCEGPTSTTIRPEDILGGNQPGYAYNPDGTMSITTGADGSWQFYMLSPPVTDRCTYALSVQPPAGSGYLYPSKRIPATAGTFASCGAVVPNAAPPRDDEPTTYYTRHVAGPNADGTSCDALHIHVPLDPGTSTGLVLRKEGSKKQVEFGDFMDYALTLINKTGFPVTGVTWSDALPAGFAYVAGSARLDGVPLDNPQGGAGPALTWQVPALKLPVDQQTTLRYRVRVGVGARSGQVSTNRATASSATAQSNEASHSVRVDGGVFSNEAFAFGKVYMDCRRDGVQDGTDEPGVAGVHLWLEDGTHVVTDADGKWSLYGLRPQTHVLRLDETTLPRGAVVELLDNRNAGQPASRFLDLKNGELHRGNFPLGGCDSPETMDEVKVRHEAAARIAANDDATAVRYRLDPQQRSVLVGDVRGMPAAGQVNGGGHATAQTVVTGPLIAVPTAPAGATGGFIAQTGGIGATGTLGQVRPGIASAGAAAASGGVAGPPVAAAPASPAAPTLIGGGAAEGERSSPALALPLRPASGPGVIDLERLLPGLDAAPGFLDFKDGDVLPSRSTNVRVKGPTGVTLRLSVDDAVIDGRRVGKKAVLESTGTAAWEYIGVVLQPGVNRLRLEIVDDFGVVRGTPVTLNVTAPDKLGAIHIDLPADARADLRTPVPVTVRVTDAAGIPVTARMQMTLEADAGRWQEEDLNPDEPGLQAFLQNGQRTFHLIPPGVPGDLRLRVAAADLVRETRLVLLPELRPMIAVGLVEGTLDLSRRGALALGQIPAGAAFEQELNAVGGSDADARAGGRTAFFLKGAIRGDYLLTAALDTGKASKDRLFRDIRPDEFYPVYGDASMRGYDAQSSQKLYVRIDKDRSYLLYGDFTTASSEEVRKLSQVSRALTGAKSVVQTGGVRVTSYGSRTSQQQQVEELPANGTSGPYYLKPGVGDYVVNSETIELVVRDRNQPNVILQRTALGRFADYTLETVTRRILFTRPIASIDANLNPQSIRVTYETDDGGPKHTVAGVDAQFAVTDRLQVGAVATTDKDPEKGRDLVALTALARLGDQTTAAAEAVRTDSLLKGAGSAARVEVRHQGEKLGAAGQVMQTSAGFDNPSAGVSAGRAEANARAEYRFDASLAARLDALYSRDETTAVHTRGATLGVIRKFDEGLSVEGGLRYGTTSASGTASLFGYDPVSSSGATAGAALGASTATAGGITGVTGTAATNDLVTVRGRLTASVPGLPQAQGFVEAEQDVRESGRHLLALGGNYAITDKTRAYGRYEPVSTLYDTQLQARRNTAVAGVDSAYMEGGRVYDEFRLAGADDTRTAQQAMGVRNTFKLDDHWRATAGLEHTRAMGSASASATSVGLGDATALTTGLDYLGERLRFAGVLEGRHGSDSHTLLNAMGLSYRLDTDWSLLTRTVYSSSQGTGTLAGNDRVFSRQQIGAAYRPVDQDVWNALARYEHKREDIRGTGPAAGSASTSLFESAAGLPGRYEAHIVSAHVNVMPDARNQLTGRLAAKVATQDDGQLKSTYAAQLVHGRWIRSLTPSWDIGLQGGLLHGSGGALQKTFGAEVGYFVAQGLWVSVGYNVLGLTDRDLTTGEYTNKGAYIRLRYKFDEGTLGLGDADRAARATAPKNGLRPEEIAAAPRAGDAVALAARETWRPGQPVPGRIVLQEKDLFALGESALTPQGTRTLEALAEAIDRSDVGPMKLSVGHGDRLLQAPEEGVEVRSTLWLARVGAMRRVLQVKGPRRIGIEVDSQTLAPVAAEPETPAVPGEARTVQLAVIAAAPPAAAATKVTASTAAP